MTNRLLTLDAMRGAAAIVVVLHHVGLGWAPSGYLAVDFFFLLSGLVIGSAYQARLARGLSFLDFAVVRAIRLYPLYALGGLLGLAAQLCGVAQDAVTAPELAAAVAFNALMVPSLFASLYAFPLNPPAWSLFFEMAINLLYAAFLVKLKPRFLLAIVMGSAVPLAIANWGGHLNEGASINGFFFMGLARTGFSFVAGVAMSRWAWEPPLRLQKTLAQHAGVLSLMVTGALVMMMLVQVWGHKRILYDMLFVFAAAPVMVWAGARVEPPPALKHICKALGDLSYPLYAIHFPSMWLFSAVARRLGASEVLWMVVFCIAIVPVAWVVGRLFERPIRDVLNGALRTDQRPPGAAWRSEAEGRGARHPDAGSRSKHTA